MNSDKTEENFVYLQRLLYFCMKSWKCKEEDQKSFVTYPSFFLNQPNVFLFLKDFLLKMRQNDIAKMSSSQPKRDFASAEAIQWRKLWTLCPHNGPEKPYNIAAWCIASRKFVVGNLWKPLQTIGNRLKPLETVANRLKLLETVENRWKPLETVGNRWKPLETFGNRCKPLETIGNLWKPLETVGNHWKPLETFLNRCKPLQTVTNRWKPLETIGNRSKPLETFGNRWKNHWKPLYM